MKSNDIAIMVFGETNSGRNALTEEKYKDLASSFVSHGFNVRSVLYNEDLIEQLSTDLLKFAAILVWVNPIEQGKDRKKLDFLLTEISKKGCLISAHPEIILKMGTKDILYKTREMDWGGDTKIYPHYEEFKIHFHHSLKKSQIRVLKQYRGNGGNGVFKIIYNSPASIRMIHAVDSAEERTMSVSDFNNEFKPFFDNNGLLIDQEWNKNMMNGMVRCYLSGIKVAGFGYQEINALYELNTATTTTHLPPGKRYYFTENCGVFGDLKEIMENKWVPQLRKILSISETMMPVIWDADFFINEINNPNTAKKYTLCEINVSSVSPFPPSAIKFIVKEVKARLTV